MLIYFSIQVFGMNMGIDFQIFFINIGIHFDSWTVGPTQNWVKYPPGQADKIHFFAGTEVCVG